MQHAQRKALEIYNENLAYLAKNHPKLHERVILLDTAISNEIYPERYALEYKNEGYFDVLEVESGYYLYGENSLQLADKIVNSMDFTRTNGVFEAQRYVDFSPEMPDIIDKSELHFHNALWATAKIVEYSKRVAPRSTQMKQVFKILFLGIGLGVHIQGVIKKMGAKVAFLQENNLELFRLSLFVTHYARLAKQCNLFLSVMEDDEGKKQTFINFLETGNNYNLYLKQISLTEEYQEDLFQYQNYVMMQEHIVYPYSAYLLRFIDSPRYIAEEKPFLNISDVHHDNILSQKPVLFLFSGPSTAKNIDWIQENKERFIIVAALSTCRYLNKQQIKPDIVVHIDPNGEGTLALLDGLKEDFFEEVILIFASNLHPDVANRFANNQVYFIEQGTNYKKGFGQFSSPSVGEYTYAIFLILGATKIYLLGIDLALDPDTLSSHSPEHPLEHKAQEGNEGVNLDYIMIPVAGNFVESVPTYTMHVLSIDQFGRMSQLFKKDQQVYNLSNGALLGGAEPLHAHDVIVNDMPELNREKVRIELINMFNGIASSEFREEDRSVLRYQLKEAKKLKSIIDKFKKQKFTMPSLYINALAKLNQELSDMDKKTGSDLAEVYYLYMKVVFSYICEIFNTQTLERPKDHIDAINAILMGQLDKIANTFIDRFEGYLKKD